MRHTSGLTYGFQQRSNVDAAYREKKIGEVDQGRHAGFDDRRTSPKFRWNFRRAKPGTTRSATDVIGYLVGKISGMPFEQFLKERIFNPLGMNDTDFFVPADKAHRFAACYSADPQAA